MKSTVTIQGTHCPSCKALIEDVSKEIPGITSCTVDFQTGSAIVEHDENFDWKIFEKELGQLGDYKLIL